MQLGILPPRPLHLLARPWRRRRGVYYQRWMYKISGYQGPSAESNDGEGG